MSTKSLIPERIRKRLPPPDRPRDNKITARFTEEEYGILERLSQERSERVSSFVRNLVLATISGVGRAGR
ncbi:MAG: hypothetical protein R3325_10055 [Thermoanaerobaculia bacterium]|nr:hypothetical protein [Thermoanaerobaculia bacterium]